MKYLSDRDYYFIYSNSPRICVDILIKHKSKVFLIKRKQSPYKNKYHMPGGRIRFRETIKSALQRIAKTEIDKNISITIVKMMGVIEFLREKQNGNKMHSISIVYEVKTNMNLNMISLTEIKNIHPIHLKFLKSIK